MIPKSVTQSTPLGSLISRPHAGLVGFEPERLAESHSGPSGEYDNAANDPDNYDLKGSVSVRKEVHEMYKKKLSEIEKALAPEAGSGGTSAAGNETANGGLLRGNASTDPAGVRFGMHPAFREQISSLRGKLIHVGERFVGFDKTMEELSMIRKSAEDNRIQAFEDDLAKLERALNTEIRRRVDYSRTLQVC